MTADGIILTVGSSANQDGKFAAGFDHGWCEVVAATKTARQQRGVGQTQSRNGALHRDEPTAAENPLVRARARQVTGGEVQPAVSDGQEFSTIERRIHALDIEYLDVHTDEGIRTSCVGNGRAGRVRRAD